MLNYIWAFMILAGIIVGILNGKIEELGNGALDSAGSAVTLCITMLGIMALWSGLMQIARASGLLEKMAGWLSPVLRFLFPRLEHYPKAKEAIATNMVANILGLGWAATPAGLTAMEELAKIEEEQGSMGYGVSGKDTTGKIEAGPVHGIGKEFKENAKQGTHGIRQNSRQRKRDAGRMAPRAASDEMCTFLILNISSLQLLPVNMLAYRSQYGSENPAAIIVPAIVATLASTIAAAVFCKIMSGKQRAEKKC